MSLDEAVREFLDVLDDGVIQEALRRAVGRLSRNPFIILERYPYLKDYAREVREAKLMVLKDIEYYIDETVKSIRDNNAEAYFARDRDEVYGIVRDIVGEPEKLIVKSKSMVTEEVGLREYLEGLGHKVYETDLGQLLIQISGDKPMHIVAPAIHMTREYSIKLLRGLGLDIDEGEGIDGIVSSVRGYLREIFIKADVGISGGNVISADTGAIYLISNEGNIRNTTNLPPIHIALISIEKIMPTMDLAFKQALVQAANAGLYPPTYLSIIAGPSSTADIEYTRVYGVHGPREQHVILYDGGRIDALRDGILGEQLLCIRCGRCQAECPIWIFTGNRWGGRVYGGPMGMGWTAIVEDMEKASILSLYCLLCGRCREVCPMDIDLPSIIHSLKRRVRL